MGCCLTEVLTLFTHVIDAGRDFKVSHRCVSHLMHNVVWFGFRAKTKAKRGITPADVAHAERLGYVSRVAVAPTGGSPAQQEQSQVAPKQRARASKSKRRVTTVSGDAGTAGASATGLDACRADVSTDGCSEREEQLAKFMKLLTCDNEDEDEGVVCNIIAKIAKVGALYFGVHGNFARAYHKYLETAQSTTRTRLQLHSETRWNSTVDMLKAFVPHLAPYFFFCDTVEGRTFTDLPRMPLMFGNLLVPVINALEAVNDIVQPLSGDTYSTMSHVIPSWCSCVRKLDSIAALSALPAVTALARRMVFKLTLPKTVCEVFTPWCCAAMFLDPTYVCAFHAKSFVVPERRLFLPVKVALHARASQTKETPVSHPSELLVHARDCIISLAVALDRSRSVDSGSECTTPRTAEPAVPPEISVDVEEVEEVGVDKLVRLEFSKFFARAVAFGNGRPALEDGQLSYVTHDPVTFWFSVTSDARASYPHLHKVAQLVFGTPASSAPSERMFSSLKRIITPQRTRLFPKRVADIALVSAEGMNVLGDSAQRRKVT